VAFGRSPGGGIRGLFRGRGRGRCVSTLAAPGAAGSRRLAGSLSRTVARRVLALALGLHMVLALAIGIGICNWHLKLERHETCCVNRMNESSKQAKKEVGEVSYLYACMHAC